MKNEKTIIDRINHLDRLTDMIAAIGSDDFYYDWDKYTSDYKYDVFDGARMGILTMVALDTKRYKRCVKYAHEVFKKVYIGKYS